ncbi:Tyrosine-protein phosphatase non-receptor type 14 [Dermatophagoides pteronyssinus]|uniref:protein-tyrosine-phosphatase n=1 Tax=Dermatophagoides pteronyssinus TaxID=6956 RepID=A0ABQ8JQS6_DERPT|nr:Tyrosine-protein phosphatase non-receptor type 14 [Dermatophagoides pteronyssinus]
MPFIFRLPGKRSQQYNVASKDLFVIPIELLTNECIECTLFATSTGEECLKNVCQKIGIQQPEYFSLLFRSKKMVDQWIDLKKSVKKQLSKYAQEIRLYFRLLYFVPNFHFLSDEVSRFHYFYAMKNLVIDGRIACSRDDAILLASFSLQAEFGDYSPERHTVEYLNNFSLFPKSMITNKIARDVLIECVINAYRNLQGVPPSVAEIYYISEAQRREGYGQEGFPARDLSTGQDVCLGVCIRGIFVVNQDNNTLELFKWMDIANLMHQKKVFTIERFTDKYSKNYSTYDSDYANCIWKTCVEQHQYFMKGIQNAQVNQQNDQTTTATNSLAEQLAIQHHLIGNNDSIMQQQQQQQPIQSASSSSSSKLLNPSTLYIHQQQQQHHGSNNSVHQQQQQSTPILQSDHTTMVDNFNNNQSVYETIGSSTIDVIPTTTATPTTTTTIVNLDHHHHQSSSLNHDNLDNILSYNKRNSIEPIDLNHIQINCTAINQYNLKSGELSHNNNNNNNNSGDVQQPFKMDDTIMSTDSSTTTTAATPTTAAITKNIPIYENPSNLNDLTYEQRKKLLPPYRMPPDYETFLTNKYSMMSKNMMSQSLTSIPSRLATGGNPTMMMMMMKEGLSNNSITASHTQINSSSSSLSLGQHSQQQQYHLFHPTNNHQCSPVKCQPFSFPQQQHYQQRQSSQQQQQPSFQNIYRNYTDLSNLAIDQSQSQSSSSKTSSTTMMMMAIPANQLPYQHQRLQKSGMFTSSSPDLNTINPLMFIGQQQQQQSLSQQQQQKQRLIQQYNPNVIKSNNNGTGMLMMLNNNNRNNIENGNAIHYHHAAPINQPQPQQSMIMKKPPYFTSVPDLTFNKQHSNLQIYPNDIMMFGGVGGGEKKFSKTRNFFRFFSGWSQNKTGSEPNLFNNHNHHHHQNNNCCSSTLSSYSPNSYYLKRTKYSNEHLDSNNIGIRNVNINNNNNNNNCTTTTINDNQIMTRPTQQMTMSQFSKISQKIDELPETTVNDIEQQQQQHLQSQTATTTTTMMMTKIDVNNDHDHVLATSINNNNNNIAINQNQSQQQTINPQQQQHFINMEAKKIEQTSKLSMEKNNSTMMPTAKTITANSRILVFDKNFVDQDFTKEFELLPRMNPTAKFTTASLAENILKNRFRDILPYEENRVKLTPTKDNKHGYINASHVIMKFGSMKQHYIAAQGPLPNTTLDFWQMVFEQHINLIVMVTNFTESGSQKCYIYLPLSSEPGKNTLRFGDYEITCTYTAETLTYMLSLLILTHNGQRRQITHLRYTDWNDHSIPGDLQSFLTFLSEMDAIYRQNNRDGSGFGRKRHSSSSLLQKPPILPPILVHCSAGVGRSGVMILCDALLKCLDDYQHSEPIDVPEALIQLRFQRMISVQHCEQFRFVCQVLSQNLSNSRLI